MLRARQADEGDVAAADNIGNRPGGHTAIGDDPGQRLRRKVERQHLLSALAHQIAADRLAHDAKTDEPDGPCHAGILLTLWGGAPPVSITSLDQRTAAFAHGPEHLFARPRADDSVVIVLVLRFFRLLHLHEIHGVQYPSIRTNRDILVVHVVDLHL